MHAFSCMQGADSIGQVSEFLREADGAVKIEVRALTIVIFG